MRGLVCVAVQLGECIVDSAPIRPNSRNTDNSVVGNGRRVRCRVDLPSVCCVYNVVYVSRTAVRLLISNTYMGRFGPSGLCQALPQSSNDHRKQQELVQVQHTPTTIAVRNLLLPSLLPPPPLTPPTSPPPPLPLTNAVEKKGPRPGGRVTPDPRRAHALGLPPRGGGGGGGPTVSRGLGRPPPLRRRRVLPEGPRASPRDVLSRSIYRRRWRRGRGRRSPSLPGPSSSSYPSHWRRRRRWTFGVWGFFRLDAGVRPCVC